MGALHFFGMCNWAYQWYRSGDGQTPRSIGENFWRMLRDGIRVRGGQSVANGTTATGPVSAPAADTQTVIRARRPRTGRAPKDSVPVSSPAE
jgi:hypothetical protein